MNARLLVVLAVAVAVTVSAVAGGCQKALRSAEVTTADPAGLSKTVASDPDAPPRGGALLWSQNCARCHNLRNPRERSDREWDVIALHMRVRGNLTAEEHREILRFLQSAN